MDTKINSKQNTPQVSLREFFLDTQDYHYKITPSVRQILREWILAFEGCVGFLLTHDKRIDYCIEGTWDLYKSAVGGIYLAPYSIFFYTDKPKIFRPLTQDNFSERTVIEQITAYYVQVLSNRIEEAHPDYEGLAMISFVEEKTGLSQKEISAEIFQKSLQIEPLTLSPLFGKLP